jgi:hypothetical protein
MTNLELLIALSGIVGAVLPLVISAVKSARWSTQTKKTTAVIVSLVAAVITTWATEGWAEWGDFVISATTVFTTAQVTYLGFWEDTMPEALAERIRIKYLHAA